MLYTRKRSAAEDAVSRAILRENCELRTTSYDIVPTRMASRRNRAKCDYGFKSSPLST